jgi:hypothetical protein
MKEAGIRMPRVEEIAKASNRNGHLAMAAAPNYSENLFQSTETNGSMVISQLRAARERIDQILGVLYPDDALPPWVAVKITNAGTSLASVSDYLRFGGESL